MKIQIDTDTKTVTIEQDVNLGELIRVLSRILPDFAWKDWTLKTNVINIQPVYPPIEIPYNPRWPQPFNQPYVQQPPIAFPGTITTGNSADSSYNNIQNGVYLFDIKYTDDEQK